MTTFLKTTDIDEAGLVSLAQGFARQAHAGMCILLFGDLGTGKSTFARAMIRVLAPCETDIPSPTFTLVQVYDGSECEVWHSDLYRLTTMDEVLELGLVDAFPCAICLIEWPEKLGGYTPQDAIKITLEHIENPEARRITIDASFDVSSLLEETIP